MADPRATRPTGQSATPVDTLDNVVKAGLNPLHYASCAEPVKGKVRGCTQWHACSWHNGPCNKGIRILKPQGARELVMPCYLAIQGPLDRAQHDQDFYAEVIAEEGETITFVGTKEAQLQPHEISRGVIPKHVPDVNHDFMVVKHPRLSDNGAMTDKLAFIKIREKALQERQARKMTDLLEIHEEFEANPNAEANTKRGK